MESIKMTEAIYTATPSEITEKEYIKIERNSRGVNWEIKVVPKESVHISDDDVQRLKALHIKMQNEFMGGIAE